jgi:ribosomal protein S18 acetylase RimI-like enzyme
VGILERAFPEGSADKHRGRLARQECGEVVYLIAWDAGTPVGHALLKWAGATEPHLVAHFRGTCPDVEDLLVAVDWRSQGIGTQLLTVAARLVSERGYARIGLSVDVRNPRARALYERLGYTDAGMGIHREEGTYVDQQGQLQRWEDICIYLVKPLTGPPPP